ncbi:MAG: glutaredoxin domain-containing protein [Peptostreptococcus sp.]|uniref:glutaredoxin domain-containing protein n=1 Tax=Peptostreptococcus sp. TaxID=1262 RepID=UPI002FC71668
MKVYGTMLCPDCPPIRELLEKKGVDYEFLNITEDLMILKEFLKLRDNRSEFDIIKQEASIGVPCMLTENDEIIFYEEIINRFDK